MDNYAIVLEDDKILANALARVVRSLGYDVSIAESIAVARTRIAQREPVVMLVDVNLPDGDGLEFMAEVYASIQPNFVVVTGDSSQQVAVKCIRARAFDMLPKPIKLADLRETVTRAMEARHREHGDQDGDALIDAPRLQSATLGIGESDAVVALRKSIARAAALDDCLCVIEGETGSEKHAVAEAIHLGSGRTGRIVTVNCAGERDARVRNRFFGIEGEAGQGSGARHQGYLEQADGGTLVLDDFTELAPDIQASLLSYIDSGTFTRTDGVDPVKTSVAVVGVARRSIEKALAEGSLNEDFYYRIARLTVAVPSLSERRDDLLAIAEHLLAGINARAGSRKSLSDDARRALAEYSWPGNVRELKNTLHRACLESDTAARIELRDLEDESIANGQREPIVDFVGKTFWQIEKELLYATLDHNGGDKEKTSRMLGISLKTLYNRLHAYS